VKRLKITSPGVLLIFAVLAAGGIFLLDLFYLQPHLAGMEKTTLGEYAAAAERGGRLMLRSERNDLLRLCSRLTDSAKLRAYLAGAPGRRSETLLVQALGIEVDWIWITDAAGVVRWQWGWSREEADTAAAVKAVMDHLRTVPRLSDSGQIRLGGVVALFARQQLTGGLGADYPAATLWIARDLDEPLLEAMASASGGPLVFVSADALPQGQRIDTSLSSSYWRADADTLMTAWLVTDPTGEVLGYIRTQLPAGHILRQSASSRRLVLIMLSLSVGLVVLVVVVLHVLVAGPVFRLLRRIQRIEADGGGDIGELTRDLHGEPLVLARRLESAFDKLTVMSKTDELTGLANRRHFHEVLDAFYHQSRRYNRPLSLFVLDIDFFKAVNDSGGHDLGDQLLKTVAAALNRACRKADLPARFGGDEFAVLLPETGSDAAAHVAKRVQDILTSETATSGLVQMNVTISVGIADLNSGEIDSPDAMICLADKALYAAKELGRNRIVQAHDLNGLNWAVDEARDDKAHMLYKKLAGLDTELKGLFLQAIEEIVELLRERAPHMADHARNVQRYAVLIAREMELPDRVIQRIEIAAMLHDIGMVAMPDSILLSTSGLDEQQLQTIRKHPLISVRIMEGMEFLEQEIPAVRYHHERYDGKGYPEGLTGAAIPLTARILSVADAFDAMTSDRLFRPAKSFGEAVAEIRSLAGSQFDPAVVEAFLAVAERMGPGMLSDGAAGPPGRPFRQGSPQGSPASPRLNR